MFRPLLFAAALLLVAPVALADDDAGKKLADLGPGVHEIKTDKKGRITSCIVIGQARVSTVLGKAKGTPVARDKARLDCSVQFVKWLGEKVAVYESSEDETILFLEGNKENDAAARKESGKAVEKSTKKMESVSNGLVRGLQVLHVEVSDKDRTYTLVMGWDRKTADKVKGIAESDGDETPAKKPVDPADPKRPDKIDDKSVTSPDLKKFLK